MKSTFFALTFASVVFAQSSTSTSAAPSSSSAASVVPTGASPGCKTFLTALNADTSINGCLTDLIDATSAFDPTSSSAAGANSTAINSALSTICSSSFHSCSAQNIRTNLTSFYTACSTDLLGDSGNGSDGVQQVIDIYDVLYLILPLKDAICSKVDGKYCVNGAATGTTTPAASGSASSSAPSSSATNAKRSPLDPSQLYKRADNVTSQESLSGLAPEADSYRNSGLPYLFLQPNSTEICSKCTAAVIGSYIRFESVTPYAMGIAYSPMLKGQLDLWTQIQQCPDGFAAAILTNNTGAAALAGGAAKSMSLGGVALGLMAAIGGVAALML